MKSDSFVLSPSFVEPYQSMDPPFGFNGLGELVFYRTYSRIKPDGTNEEWWETCKRVVEGCYTMQKRHIMQYRLGWNERKAQKSAQEMYDRMFHMKFLPPGRGLWAMGAPVTDEKRLFASLNNCGFVSTEDINETLSEPFCFLMDMSMLGVGVGFDVKGAGKLQIKAPKNKKFILQIPDTREGWVDSLKLLLESYFFGGEMVEFDYSLIRKAGEPIKGFGGIASGPEPLIELHSAVREVLDAHIGSSLSIRGIVDIMNLIGKCVVAGNVRRTAEIVFGPPDNEEYLNLKNYRWDPEAGKYVGPSADRADFGWTSNNSVFATVGMDYSKVAEKIAINGEPGLIWLDNVRKYGRLCERELVDKHRDRKNWERFWKDRRAAGGNPCNEQSLESFELCCLVETFPAKHESLEDYIKTLKVAYLYAKTVTLGQTHWEKTNRVLLRNRRIGCSISGVQQFIAERGIEEFRRWCEEGYEMLKHYDEIYSDWMAIPKSIKMTSVKPSGTVSLLAGATPGMHWPESLYYIRRVRLSKNSKLVKPLMKAGYKVEPCIGQEDSTVVVEIPVKIDSYNGKLKTVSEVSIWEQVSMAAFLQKYWADNQVSATITFDPKTESDQIERVLNYFQYDLKGISFLPRTEHGSYAQMPYQAITKEEYEELSKGLKPLKLGKVMGEEVETEKYCSNDSCTL